MAFDYLRHKPGPRRYLHGLPDMGLGDPTVFDAGVQSMQNALVVLSKASNRPNITPDVTNGILTDGTMYAVVAAMDLFTEKLSATEFLALQATFLLGTVTPDAKNLVQQYAPDIAAAALGAAQTVIKAPSAPVIFTLAWFETPIGIAILLGGLFLGYKMFVAPPAQ